MSFFVSDTERGPESFQSLIFSEFCDHGTNGKYCGVTWILTHTLQSSCFLNTHCNKIRKLHMTLSPPCMMCVQYIGNVQYIGGIPWVHWGISCVHRGDIMCTSGDIMMHVWEQVGKNLSISIENPGVLNISQCTEHPPMHLWYPPEVPMISARCTHGIPPMYSWYPPTCIMISHRWTEHPLMNWTSPDVLMVFPRCTHDIPPLYYGIPPMYSWYPPMYSWYPPDVLNTPGCTHDIPPMYSWYLTYVLNIPDVLNKHYTGWSQSFTTGEKSQDQMFAFHLLNKFS